MDEKVSCSKIEENESGTECTICLQSFIQPVQLPCKHTFCYLCVKGIIQQNNKCALCREVIPQNYLNSPQLLAAQQPSGASNSSYQWFYEGSNGWWQYDDRTSVEIETAYQNGQQQCDVLIAGNLYTVDFQRGQQFQKYKPHCSRHIKRDLITVPKKGVAGMRQTVPVSTSCGTTCSKTVSPCNVTTSAMHQVTPLSTNCGTSKTDIFYKAVTSVLQQIVPLSTNCGASKTDSSCSVTTSATSSTQDDEIAPTSSKKQKTESSHTLEVTEHIFKKEDVCITFGRTIASKLNEMDHQQRLYAEKIINDTLFQGLLGKLSENSHVAESL